MKKKIRKLLGVLLGLSIMVTTTLVSYAAVSSDWFNEIVENNTPVCGDGYDCYPVGDAGWLYIDKEIETPNLSLLTPTEHSEYAEGDLYIVDDIYVQTCEPLNASVASTSGWEYKTITVNRSIYDNPSKNYGTLYATMTLTAQFKWDGTTSRVVGIPNYYTSKSTAGKSLEISTKEVSYKSDQGANIIWGNKYAYAEYVITIENFPKSLDSFETTSKDFRLYVSVNRNGKMNTDN